MIHHQQMIGDGVISIAVAARGQYYRVGQGAHFLVEHAVTQRLGGIDLPIRPGDSQSQISGPKLPDAHMLRRQSLGQVIGRAHDAGPP